MSKFRVTPVVRGYDFCPVEFDTLEAAKEYVRNNPPDFDSAFELVSGDPEFLEMEYVIADCDDAGRAKVLGTVADGQTWIEEEAEV